MDKSCEEFAEVLKHLLPEYQYIIGTDAGMDRIYIRIVRSRARLCHYQPVGPYSGTFCVILFDNASDIFFQNPQKADVSIDLSDPNFDIEDLLCNIIAADNIYNHITDEEWFFFKIK